MPNDPNATVHTAEEQPTTQPENKNPGNGAPAPVTTEGPAAQPGYVDEMIDTVTNRKLVTATIAGVGAVVGGAVCWAVKKMFGGGDSPVSPVV